jgi:N-glycosylase/DNA lyase
MPLASETVIPAAREEIDLDHTLESGQAFRWTRDEVGWWSCGLTFRPAPSAQPIQQIVRVKQNDDGIAVKASGIPIEATCDYLRLDVSLNSLAASWSAAACDEITAAIRRFPGLRVLRQDPVECLFSFLMSPAAPIFRIRRCMDGLCRQLGPPLGEIDGREHYGFPPIEALAATSRAEYDKLGFGFRGENIRQSAQQVLANGGDEWLIALRHASYAEAKAQLMTLRGIGDKVADCVCLFSLDKDEAVPIDVHMARVAARLFGGAQGKSLTPKLYAETANRFRERYGVKAGWAQQYLYYAEINAAGLWDESLGRHRPSNRDAKG